MNSHNEKRSSLAEDATELESKRTGASSEEAELQLVVSPNRPLPTKATRELLPTESLAEFQRFLNRDEIEAAQHVHRKFRLASNMILFSDKSPPPLRRIAEACVYWEGVTSNGRVTWATVLARRSETDDRTRNAGLWEETIDFLESVLHHSVVDDFFFANVDEDPNVCDVSSPLWLRFLDACRTTQIATLHIKQVNLCPLSRDEFTGLLDLNITTRLYLHFCRLLPQQIDDDFLRRLAEKNLETVRMQGCMPVDKAVFDVSDDAIIELLFPEGAERVEKLLRLEHIRLTDAFYEKFLQAAQSQPTNIPAVQCDFSPLPADVERSLLPLGFIRIANEDEGVSFYLPDVNRWITISLWPSRTPPILAIRSARAT